MLTHLQSRFCQYVLKHEIYIENADAFAIQILSICMQVAFRFCQYVLKHEIYIEAASRFNQYVLKHEIYIEA